MKYILLFLLLTTGCAKDFLSSYEKVSFEPEERPRVVQSIEQTIKSFHHPNDGPIYLDVDGPLGEEVSQYLREQGYALQGEKPTEKSKTLRVSYTTDFVRSEQDNLYVQIKTDQGHYLTSSLTKGQDTPLKINHTTTLE